LLQIAFVIWSILSNSKKFEIVTAFASAVSFFVALYVVNSRDKGAYKTSLVFLILLFPIFGGLFYILFKGTFPWRSLHRGVLSIEEQTKSANLADAETQKKACVILYFISFVWVSPWLC
jgi:cardiolipin synthase